MSFLLYSSGNSPYKPGGIIGLALCHMYLHNEEIYCTRPAVQDALLTPVTLSMC